MFAWVPGYCVGSHCLKHVHLATTFLLLCNFSYNLHFPSYVWRCYLLIISYYLVLADLVLRLRHLLQFRTELTEQKDLVTPAIFRYFKGFLENNTNNFFYLLHSLKFHQWNINKIKSSVSMQKLSEGVFKMICVISFIIYLLYMWN